MSTFELIILATAVVVTFEFFTFMCSLVTNLNANRELEIKWASITRLLKYYETIPIKTINVCHHYRTCYRTRRYGIAGVTHLSDYGEGFCGTVSATTFLKVMRRIKKADDNFDSGTARKELNRLKALCACLAEADEKENKRRYII